MAEIWDLYDINRKKLGKILKRGIDKPVKGEYHIVVTAVIINSKDEILLSKRSAKKKKNPLMWECNGGSILSGETSLEGVLREVKEEMGIELSKKEAIFLKEIIQEKKMPKIRDIWVFKKDINIEDLQFTDGEVEDAKWVTIEELLKMRENGEISSTLIFDKKDYYDALNK